MDNYTITMDWKNSIIDKTQPAALLHNTTTETVESLHSIHNLDNFLASLFQASS